MNHSISAYAIAALLAISSAFAPINELSAQRSKKNKKGKTSTSEGRPAKKDAIKSLSDLTKTCALDSGLFSMYSDTASGESWFIVPDSMLEKEFIYFSHINDGVAQSGFTRGSYRNSKVISFHKHFDRIEIHAENTNYHFDSTSPLARASSANFNTPILASLKVEGMDSSKTVAAAAKDAGAEITGYVRVEVGEGIEKKEEDFATHLLRSPFAKCPKSRG